MRSDFRPTFLKAIDKALSIRAKDRPQSVAEWRDELFVGYIAPDARSLSRPISRPPPVVLETLSTLTPTSAPRVSSTPPSRKAPVDMSWLDEPVPIEDEKKVQSAMDNAGVRKAVFGGLGLVFGAIAGALSSIILVSAISVSCSGNSCYMSYLPVCTAIGALLGLGIGLVVKPQSDGMEFQEGSNDKF